MFTPDNRSTLKSLVIVLALVLACAPLVAGAAGSTAEAAARRTVTLSAPVTVEAGQPVPLRGRATHTSAVRIERAVDGRWVLVRRTTVRAGYYRTTVPQTTGTARYRAGYRTRTGGVFSPARSVRIVGATVAARTMPADACGARPAKADGSLWTCTLADEFDGAELDRSLWVPQTRYASGVQAAHACYLDDPSVINQSGGYLNLTVRRVETPVSCDFGGMSGPTNYVSGSVMTYHLFSQQYGRFEARIKNTATSVPGLHEAFWLWPDDRYPTTELWPYAGEIDVSETYSRHPSLSIPFLHYAADVHGPQPGVNTAWDCAAARGEWNTYTLTWTAQRLEIAVNGRTCLVNTSADPAFQKPYIMALSQMMGAAGNEFDGRAPIPATMSVDYLRVWR